jgi:ABC-2 type transport system ATP-binding protein
MDGLPDRSALTAEAVGKRYGSRVWALRDVTLAMPHGSITALVGPNGAGKSTLIKAWVGFERPTEGRVAVRGIDPWRDRRAAVLQVGYVPQTPSLYRELSADDHLALAQTLRRGFDRAVARRRLQQLGIPLDARPTELSGGQQAQLGLALALGTRAPVLLLDEPLASLDPLARREFLAVLTEAVRGDGSTAVLSSHIITDVEAVCDRVVALGGGRKLLDATVVDALGSHVIASSREAAGDRFVAAFDGPAGEPLILARRGGSMPGAGERTGTLEEVVIGYLAAGRLPAIAA